MTPTAARSSTARSFARQTVALAIGLCCAAAMTPTASRAQTHLNYPNSPNYPNKPIRFILPFPPGGPTDLLGRSLADKLGEQLGQAVIAENRPGAGGNLGAEVAAKAAPDGYTIVLCAPSLAISPSLYAKLTYDPQRDLAPIQLIAQIPNVLVVHSRVPAKSLAEFIEYAKAHPGKLNFGSGGAGTSNHLGGELLKTLTGTDIVHVPYKGVETAMKAMLGGDVDMVVIGIPPTLAHIKAGRLRPLAVLGRERVAALPDVPTAGEAGLAALQVDTWYGVLAPSATPRELIDRLNREITRALESPDLRERLGKVGIQTLGGTPESFREFLAAETAKWATVVKASGAKVN